MLNDIVLPVGRRVVGKKPRKPRPFEPKNIKPLKSVIDAYLLRSLRACQGNKMKCARLLGLNRGTFIRMLEEVGKPKKQNKRGTHLHLGGRQVLKKSKRLRVA